MNGKKELEKLHTAISTCKKCRLHVGSTHAVPGEGPDDSKIMFVGEGPGKNEDLQGRPFVGQAGKILTESLEAVGIKRSSVFITSVVKHRPPKNRFPKPDEIRACLPYLQTQIKIINPKIICTLGNLALKTLVDKNFTITKVHGKIIKKEITYFPTFHPAAGRRNPKFKIMMQDDFKKLKLLISKRT
jgi:DNA polymerase